MEFTHFDENGNACMVDISEKAITHREAVATGTIVMNKDVFAAIEGKKIKKGDVLTVATTAGIMAAKRTFEQIPMCHLLNLTGVSITYEKKPEVPSITVYCRVKTDGKTGVEMEALNGVSTTLLTIYDMCKAIDKRMAITDIHLCTKSGGKSGDFNFSNTEFPLSEE